jgi:curved DNA-binding protein CbpA
MDAAKDYYQVLGVTADADAAAIQTAYRALAKKFHPDAPGETRSAERFIEVQQAYEVLGSRESKDSYDAAREAARSEQERQERERAKEDATWRAMVKDEPEIADHLADLSSLAKSLGRRYRSGILAGMDDRSPGDFAHYLEEQFLTRHFGKDPQIQRLGKALLEDGQRSTAAELAGELRKLPAGRLTPQHRKDLVARFKLKRPSNGASGTWPRFAPFVGLAVVLGLIAVGLVDFMRSGPKDVPATEVALPSFGGPKLGQGLKPIDDRLAIPEMTATITRDEPPPAAPAPPKKRIYDRIEMSD